MSEDWNYEKNGMDSSEISRNDNRKFWWKCKKCGYEWRASVNNRNSNNRGCPNCSKEKQRISYRNSKIDSNGSLADVNPELAKEWHPTKNGELTPYNVTSGCSDKVWWLLPYDDPTTGKHFEFEWEATIASRNSGCGCPFLQGRIWTGFNDITVTNSDVAAHWHPTKNGELKANLFTKGSHRKVWWLGDCGHEFKSEIASQCYKFSCPICSKEQQSSFPEQAIFYYIKQMYNDSINGDRNVLDGLELDIFVPSIRVAVEYDGSAWHKDVSKDLEKDRLCLSKNIKLFRVREDDCEKYESEAYKVYYYKYGILEELSEIISDIIYQVSGKKSLVNILNDEDKIYSSYLSQKQYDSIGTLYPEIAKLWHPTVNVTIKMSV